jgi:hypothetical protein
VDRASFSADGKRALYGSSGVAQLWDLQQGRAVGQLPMVKGEALRKVALSANGKLAALMAGESLRIWDLVASKELASFKVTNGTDELELSADARYALTADLMEVILWGLPSAGL